MKETIIILVILIYISGCILTELRQIAVENTFTLKEYKSYITGKMFSRWVMVSFSWMGLVIVNSCIAIAEINPKEYFSYKRKNRMKFTTQAKFD